MLIGVNWRKLAYIPGRILVEFAQRFYICGAYVCTCIFVLEIGETSSSWMTSLYHGRLLPIFSWYMFCDVFKRTTLVDIKNKGGGNP